VLPSEGDSESCAIGTRVSLLVDDQSRMTAQHRELFKIIDIKQVADKSE